MQSSVPSAILDFSQALAMLVNSQGDITTLITKWDQITNTDSPATVDIELSDGTVHTVDNLAKIRNDLIAGLSLDEPTVKSLKFQGVRENGISRATIQTGLGWHGSDEYAFDKYPGFAGVYRNLVNDFRTVCIPNQSRIELGLLELPRIILLGAQYAEDADPISELTVDLSAPSRAYAEQGLLSDNRHYYTMVTIVNRYTSATGTASQDGYPVTVHWVTGDGVNLVSYDRTIKPKCSASFLMFAPAGGSIVNIQEIVSDSLGV